MYKFQEKPYTFGFLTYASMAQVNIFLIEMVMLESHILRSPKRTILYWNT